MAKKKDIPAPLETAEMRAARLRLAKTVATKVKPCAKKYDRQKMKRKSP